MRGNAKPFKGVVFVVLPSDSFGEFTYTILGALDFVEDEVDRLIIVVTFSAVEGFITSVLFSVLIS